jgi:hypothetical protein
MIVAFPLDSIMYEGMGLALVRTTKLWDFASCNHLRELI